MAKEKVIEAEIVDGNEDRVTEEDWQGLTNSLGGMVDELSSVVQSIHILRNEGKLDKDVIKGYFVSAEEIRKEIVSINEQIQSVDKTDNGLGVIDYVSLFSEVTQLETLLAALVHDTTTDLVSMDIMSNSNDLGKDLAEIGKLGSELLKAGKAATEETEKKNGQL